MQDSSQSPPFIRRAATARAQASSLYLLAYYLGSSVSGTGGGFVWSAWGWAGVVILILVLLALAGLVVLRLGTLAPPAAERAATPAMAARYDAGE